MTTQKSLKLKSKLQLFGQLLAGLFLLLLPPGNSRAETSLTLVTFNIHVGVPMGEGIGQYTVSTKDLDGIADLIRETGGDVVALQEVDCEYGYSFPDRRRSSLLNQARYLAAAVGDKSYIFGSAQDDTGYPTDNGRYVEWGKPSHWTNNMRPHGEVGNALLWDFHWELTTAPINIELPKDEGQERRAAIFARLALMDSKSPSKSVAIYATHLQHNSGETRYKQMAALLDHAAANCKGELVFIMGDLNHELASQETSNPIQLALDRGYYDLAAPAPGSDPKESFTFPADLPDRRIDFILSSQPVKVLDIKAMRSQVSDHLPVVVTVSW